MTNDSLDQVSTTIPNRREAKQASSQNGSAPQRTAPVPPGFPPDPKDLRPCEHGFMGGVVPEVYRPLKRARLAPRDAAAEGGGTGRSLGYYLSLAAAHPRGIDLASSFERLARTIRRRAFSDPDAFATEIINHGLSTAGFVHFRLVYYLDRLLSNYDLGRDGDASLPTEVVEVLMPASCGSISTSARWPPCEPRSPGRPNWPAPSGSRTIGPRRIIEPKPMAGPETSNGVKPAANGPAEKRHRARTADRRPPRLRIDWN